jgi:hypothetical protein
MSTFVLERPDRLIFTSSARIVHAQDEVSVDLASAANFAIEKSNPYITWITGSLVEADKPNLNTQMWTKDDLAVSEYSIKYSPLNMLHKQQAPIGFLASTQMIDLKDHAAADGGTAKIDVLAGVWSHVFPFETALIQQADEKNMLNLSMECRSEKIHCAGPDGCDQSFDYMDTENHCAHLKERTSIRHLVNPTFRGAAILVPPVQPGWQGAGAGVVQEAIEEQAAQYADSAKSTYTDLTVPQWEQLMRSVLDN